MVRTIPIKNKNGVRPAASDSQKRSKANLIFALIFAAQAVAVPLLGAAKSAPVTVSYLAADTLGSQAGGHQLLAVATRHLFDMPLLILVSVFLGIMAIMHLLVATRLRKGYEAQQARGINAYFWAGFGLASGLIMVALALLSGLSHIGMLLAILVLTVVGYLCIPMVQVIHNERPSGFLAHGLCTLAVVLIATPWLLVASSIKAALWYDGQVPAALWTIAATTLGLYLLLTLVTHYRIVQKGRMASASYAERVYMVLGLLIPSVVAWQLYAETFIK